MNSFIRAHRRILLAAFLALYALQASAVYTPAFCNAVAGTLNIFWEGQVGPGTPCTGIEFTNGTLADAADGNINMTGTGVSNPACIGTAAYTFTLSADRTQLVGFDTVSAVPMTLTRTPTQSCFVGTWTSGGFVYEAHIWAGAFPAFAIPTLGMTELAVLATLLAAAGWFALRRRA